MNQNLILHQLAAELGKVLSERQLKITTAESCTGGWLATEITAITGSSAWFERGFITYSNEAKQELLGVKDNTLDKFGAVSQEVAIEMAQGALTHSHAQISCSITGIAGPTGGTLDKPVGTVWIAWSTSLVTQSRDFLFAGDRNQVRFETVKNALHLLIHAII